MGKKVFVDLSTSVQCGHPAVAVLREAGHRLHAHPGEGRRPHADASTACSTPAPTPTLLVTSWSATSTASVPATRHEMPVDAYTGDAVCLDIQIEKWGLILRKHLDDACERADIKPEELKGMVVCLDTGMHLQVRRLHGLLPLLLRHRPRGRQVVREKYMSKCVAMDMQALDHPLHTAMGKNGPPQMNLPGDSGRPITEEYIEKFGIEAYAEFERDVYIDVYGMDKYIDAKFGELEAIGQRGDLGALPQAHDGPRHRRRREPRRRPRQGRGQALPLLLLPAPLVAGRRLHGPLRRRDRRGRLERRAGSHVHVRRHRLRSRSRLLTKE